MTRIGRYILNTLTVLSLVLCVAAVGLCVRSNRAAADRQQPTTQRSHPFWTLTPAEKRKLLVGASTLKAGDRYDEVVAALGKPTDDLQLVPKGSNVSHGRSLSYQAVVWEEDLVNEFNDEWVHVVLDTHNVVREVRIRLTVSDDAGGIAIGSGGCSTLAYARVGHGTPGTMPPPAVRSVTN